MALTNLAQGKDKLQGTTSCIIQKSSHISEVKTVKVPLVQQFWESGGTFSSQMDIPNSIGFQ